jgi:hypothetical protein
MSTIERVSIPELMDGRYFYIPDYQRGYRWTPDQVEALLRDLFIYAVGASHSNTSVDNSDYYCLQPIVTRKIVDPVEIQEIENVSGVKLDPAKGIWEIVDGQQRLTTIYILYKYLMNENSWNDSKLLSRKKMEVYHIHYSTRKNSSSYLQNICNHQSNSHSNIDYYHMQGTYDTINDWIYSQGEYSKTGASVLCRRYHITDDPDTVIEILWKLLNTPKGVSAPNGTVQFLWYELDPQKKVIQEFRENNANQVGLTDAELIKALFLRKISGPSSQVMLERSHQWESVENTLQINSFWCFLNKKGQDLPSRIDLLFKLRYQLEELDKKPDNVSEDDCLNACEKKLATKNYLFNYFNDKFDGVKDLPSETAKEWQEIMTIFHTLEDWYDDAICYNLIGMLSQFDNSHLAKYYHKFDHMDENQSRDEFKQYLKNCIREQFQDLKYDKSGKLTLSYKSRKTVFNLLLLLNIHHLNNQAEGVKSIIQNGTTYKFPFAVLNKAWNIEHIDSFTTKNLEDPKDMCDWIDVALTDLRIEESDRVEIAKLRSDVKNKKALKKAIDKLKKIAKEEEMTDDQKNNISNLTLLDEETNKSYGNSLFVTKRRIIINRMKSGTYVPITTYFVFMKLFDVDGTSPRTEWRKEDMVQYHDYICDQLQYYLPSK